MKSYTSVQHDKADECTWPHRHARENNIRQQHIAKTLESIILNIAFLSFLFVLLKFNAVILQLITYQVNRFLKNYYLPSDFPFSRIRIYASCHFRKHYSSNKIGPPSLLAERPNIIQKLQFLFLDNFYVTGSCINLHAV